MEGIAHSTNSMKNKLFIFAFVLLSLTMGSDVFAAAADTAFTSLYTFFRNAATSNLVRSVCVVGGIFSACAALVDGKILLAATGASIAIFGMLSPTIIATFFTGAML